MEEYVSKQEAVKFMSEWFAGYVDIGRMLCAIMAFNHAPSVGIIRCKDCKHNGNPPECGNAACNMFYGMMEQMGYCCYGEPRDEAIKQLDKMAYVKKVPENPSSTVAKDTNEC